MAKNPHPHAMLARQAPDPGEAKPVKLSASIMHVTHRADRRANVITMRRQIPGVRVVRDPQLQGCWATARAAWLTSLRDPDATHHLLLCDDLQLCSRFPDAISAAIAARPDDVIIPYANDSVIEQAAARGSAWAKINTAWGQGVCFPTGLLLDFLRWERASVRQDPAYRLWDDRRVWLWLWDTDRWAWATVPCLVQHAMPTRSSIGFNNPGKVAKVWSPEPREDWSVGSDVPTRYRPPPPEVMAALVRQEAR